MFSNSKNIESIGKLLLEFKKYLELQKEFVKLDATEKMTVILSAILIVTVLLLLGSIVLLFLTFALAYYLGDVLGSLSLGFGLISAFILLLTVIFSPNSSYNSFFPSRMRTCTFFSASPCILAAQVSFT